MKRLATMTGAALAAAVGLLDGQSVGMDIRLSPRHQARVNKVEAIPIKQKRAKDAEKQRSMRPIRWEETTKMLTDRSWRRLLWANVTIDFCGVRIRLPRMSSLAVPFAGPKVGRTRRYRSERQVLDCSRRVDCRLKCA